MNIDKDSKLTRIFFAVFGLLIISTVLYHSFSSLFNPYETQEAVEMTVKKTVSADCYIIRKENIIKSDYTGYKVFRVSNGGKVAKNSTVISFYEKANDVATANEINTLEDYLSQIEEINKQNSIHNADLDIISEQTASNIYSFLNDVNSNNLADAKKSVSQLRYFIAQGQLATGREKNYISVIKSLNEELNILNRGYDENVKKVKSEYSGYFVNFTDGYENSVNYDNINDITVNDIENIKAERVADNQVGRVISENEWYIVCNLNTADSKDLSKGDKIKISTSLSNSDELSVTVKAVNRSSNKKKTAVVFSCMEMNEELATVRKQNMQVILKTYKGLKVNKDAVRAKNGKKGVYVERGSVRKFVETDIIYNSSDYCIVKSNNGDGELKIYDEVIVKGRGLDE
ncbi:MAG: hypothetical protein IJO19_01330 [Clostridia bacterium]|nr:hypothetical protein [Clostridia bacterium]